MSQRNILFNKSLASHPASKYWSNENKVSPRQVSKSSHKRFIFDCPTCFHAYNAQPRHITSGSGCGYCANKYLCNDNSCGTCYEKSFASFLKAKYWSDENEISPRKIFKTSHKKCLFDCNVCDHTFSISPSDVVAGSFCPYCASKRLCDNDCDTCYKKSFASNIMSKFWSDENEVSPRQVLQSSGKKYKFNCDTCDHIHESSLHNVTNKGSSCPYCSKPVKRLCADNSCVTCFNNCFSSCPQSKFWSSSNNVTPRQVIKFSSNKYKFDCPYCNQIYEARINSITCNGSWCSCIKNKTETIVYKYLQSIMDGPEIAKHKKFKWCKQKRYLPFDFCIKDFKIIIELDGLQHFKQVSNWDDPEKRKETDIYKMKRANRHGYSVIRIFQEDVWNNKNNWKRKLYNSIQTYDEPTNILIGKIYDDYPVYQDV